MSAALSNSVRLKRRQKEARQRRTMAKSRQAEQLAVVGVAPAAPPTQSLLNTFAPSPLQKRKVSINDRHLAESECPTLHLQPLVRLLRSKLSARSRSDESIVRRHHPAGHIFSAVAGFFGRTPSETRHLRSDHLSCRPLHSLCRRRGLAAPALVVPRYPCCAAEQ